jgi:GH35 family endo-1,4-beta-xylanase
MGHYKTYISFVIQKEEQHIHDSIIAELSLPKFNFYSDNTSQEVLKWAYKKQQELKPNEKLVILNYFNISNIK